MKINGVETPKEKEKVSDTEKIATLEAENADFKTRLEDVEIILADAVAGGKI
jgi:hypothetical protein